MTDPVRTVSLQPQVVQQDSHNSACTPTEFSSLRSVPPGSAEIFRQWQIEAKRARFTKGEYAAAFEDFWEALAKGDCVLHALLCEWTRLLREQNRACVGEDDAHPQQLPDAA